MTLLEHLRELRSRLVRICAAVVVGSVIAYVFYDQVLAVLIGPYCDLEDVSIAAADCRLRVDAPLEGFSIRIKVSMLLGLFIGGPVVFWQLWRFVVPGLTDTERRYAAPFVFVSQALFGLGIAFAWFVLPNALVVLTRIAGDGVRVDFQAREYISFILTTSLAFGIVFLLPVVLTFLGLVGLVSASSLRAVRPYAIVGQSILAAVITPTTDPVTMLAMMLPMVVFYELAVGLTWLFERRRTRRAAAP